MTLDTHCLDITQDQLDKLRCNWTASERGRVDHPPVIHIVKPSPFAAEWLICEMAPDEDTMFGLADTGEGRPTLGYISRADIEKLAGDSGGPPEVDHDFHTNIRMSEFAKTATHAGRIIV